MKSFFLELKCFPVKGFLLVLLTVFLLIGPAQGIEHIYHSIHLASFKNLRNANGFVNTLTKKGKMVFWKKADIHGKGEYYRVYMGKYKNREEAVEFWKILKKEGAVNYFGIHEFREEIPPTRIEEVPAIPVPKPKEKEIVQASIPLPDRERFFDNKDGTITDKRTNLMWIKNGWRIELFSAVKWQDAIKKCEDFNYGGYTNWRLPTIKEWKSLLDREKECPALVEPNPFENIIVHMPYWSQTEFNYTSKLTTPLKDPTRAYTVMLYYGRVGHQNTNKRAFVLPVRSLD